MQTLSFGGSRVGLGVVAFGVLSERFSFWGIQAVIVLFLVQVFSQSEGVAFAEIGAFGALSYLFSLLGGVIADKLLGAGRACVLGLCLCIMGNFILAIIQQLTIVYIGFSLVLVGAGLFSPNSSAIVNLLYEKQIRLKEVAFLFVCIASNISGALAPFIYGIFVNKGWWSVMFFISVVINTIALFAFIKYSRCQNVIIKKYYGEIATCGLIFFSWIFLTNIDWFDWLILIAIFIFGGLITAFWYTLDDEKRKNLGFILVLTVILLIFYIAVFQIYSSLTIFITHYVRREFMQWQVPIPLFASLQCIFFILCAPLVERGLAVLNSRGIEIGLLQKVIIGLSLGAVGFLFFSIGEAIARVSGSCGMEWVILGNFFLGFGEVFLYPPILAAVANFSPKGWIGSVIGGFSIALAGSSYFAGVVANFLTNQWKQAFGWQDSVFNLSYVKIATCLVGLVIVSGLVFSLLQKWYQRQQSNNQEVICV